MTNESVSRRRFLYQTGQMAAGVITASTLSSCQTAQPQPAPVTKGKSIGINDYQIKLDREKLMESVCRYLQGK